MKRIIFALPLLLFCLGCDHYSQGDRVGVVYKFSRKGIICKTWEGEMNLGGMRQQSDANGNSQTVPNVWAFTVRDEDLNKFKPVIDDSMATGATVKISYDQSLVTLCSSDPGNFVSNIVQLKH